MKAKEQTNLDQRKNCLITYDTTYNELPINTNNQKDGCIVEILDYIHAHLLDMRLRHSHFIVTRFDLKSPDPDIPLTNKIVGRIFENMTRAIGREKAAQRNNPDTRIFGVWEKTSKGTIHYHCATLINANVICYPKQTWDLAELYLAKAYGLKKEEVKGKVHYCNAPGPNGIIVRHEFPYFIQPINLGAAMHMLSYLAKNRTKETISKGQHLYLGTTKPQLTETQ